jgi:hypothetical protein
MAYGWCKVSVMAGSTQKSRTKCTSGKRIAATNDSAGVKEGVAFKRCVFGVFGGMCLMLLQPGNAGKFFLYNIFFSFLPRKILVRDFEWD